MKYLVALSVLLFISSVVFAQSGGHQRAGTSFTVNMMNSDASAYGGYYNGTQQLIINNNYGANNNNTGKAKWVASQYDSLISTSGSPRYVATDVITTIDSIILPYQYTNSTFTNDTLFVSIYSGDIQVNSSHQIIGSAVYNTFVILNNGNSTFGSTALFIFRPNYHFPSPTNFSIGYEFRGNVMNLFTVLGGYGNTCSSTCGAKLPRVGKNTILDLITNAQTGYQLDNGGNSNIVDPACSPSGVTYNDATCNAYKFQDLNANVYVTVVRPLVANITGSTSICQGDSTTLTASATGGSGAYTYTWSTGGTGTSITVSAVGAYSVTVSDGSGTATRSTSVSTLAPATLAITSNPSPPCVGVNVTYSATGVGINPAAVCWYTVGDTTLIATGRYLMLGNTQTVPVGTLIYARVATLSGCPDSAVSNAIAFTFCPVSVGIFGTTTICSGTTTTLTADVLGATGAIAYHWNTGDSTSAIQTATAGTYGVTVVDANGNSATAFTIVHVNPNATLPITSLYGPPCYNQSMFFTTNPTNIGNAGVDWYVNGNYASSGYSYQPVDLNIGDVVTATTAPDNGCPAFITSNPITIIYCGGACIPDNSYTNHGLYPSNNNIDCAINNIYYSSTLTLVNYDYIKYQGNNVYFDSLHIDSIKNLPCGLSWLPNKVSGAFLPSETGCILLYGIPSDQVGQYQLHIVFTVFANNTSFQYSFEGIGVYKYIRVIDNSNASCPNVTNGVSLVACASNPPPTVTISGNGLICAGGTTTITAVASGGLPPYTYHWSNGATTAANTVSVAGTYIVTVKAADSSEAHATMNVQVTNCTGIEELSFDAHVTLYPNPTNGKFILNIDQNAEQMDIRVLNIQGKTIYAQHLANYQADSKEIDLGAIAKGVYLLKVNTEHGSAVKRLVVQ